MLLPILIHTLTSILAEKSLSLKLRCLKQNSIINKQKSSEKSYFVSYTTT